MSQVRRLDQIPAAQSVGADDKIAIWQGGRTRVGAVSDLTSAAASAVILPTRASLGIENVSNTSDSQKVLAGNPVADAIAARASNVFQRPSGNIRTVDDKLKEAATTPADYGASTTPSLAAALAASSQVDVPRGTTVALSGALDVPPGKALVFNPGSAVTGTGTVTNRGAILRYAGAASTLPYHPTINFGPCAFQADSTGTSHGLMGTSNQTSTINSFPCAVVALSQLNSAGNTAFGVFGRCDLYTAGCATHELNTFNFAGFPASFVNGAPSRAFGITDPNPVTLTLGAGGPFPSTSAVQVVQEGEVPSYYRNAVYVYPGAVSDIGIFLDATSTQSPTTSQIIKNTGAAGRQHLFMQTTGTAVPNGPVISHADAGGNATWLIRQSGRAEFSETRITQALPVTALKATGAPTDAKVWRDYVDNAGNMHVGTLNDAESAGNDALVFSRTGNTPTAMRAFVPFQFVNLASAPASPQAGWTYYDTTLNKARTWDGTTWNNLF